MIRKLSLLPIAAALMAGSAFAGAGLGGSLDADAVAQAPERPSSSMMRGGAMNEKRMMESMSSDPEMRRHMATMERSMGDMSKLMRDHMSDSERP